MMDELIRVKRFSDIDLGDSFFDSLKSDYQEFEEWFKRKSEKKALIFEEAQGLVAFLYLKIEEEVLIDIVPERPLAKRLKVGTFKIEAHGTKLGERFLKKLFDYAIDQEVEEIYVTIFPKHSGLIRLFQTFGFEQIGTKETQNGIENVYGRSMTKWVGSTLKDYPYFANEGNKKYLLAIHPDFHSRLFADSILNNESYSVVKDTSHTNSIHKVYVSWMKDLEQINAGDLLVIYRTKDGEGPAWYRSVATSVCTVLEVRQKDDFASMESYLGYCEKYSVFNREELAGWWGGKYKAPLTVIKMVYNAAFTNRLIRGRLIDDVGLDPDIYWGFFELEDEKFTQIVSLGGANHLQLN